MTKGVTYKKDIRGPVKTRDNLVTSKVDVARRCDIGDKLYTTTYTSMNLC